MPVAGAADDGVEQRELGVRKPVQLRGEENVRDMLVAVHHVDGAADVEDSRRTPHRIRQDERASRLDGAVQSRRNALPPCRRLARPAAKARNQR
jgi:hypothetical protein